MLAEPEPAATFRRGIGRGHRDVVTWHPQLLAHPMALVAVLAHGLAHHLLEDARSEPPGGVAAWDPATDLVAVALGFGVFLANAAHVVAWEEGLHWEGISVRCQGWLSQREIAEALALFCHLHALPARPLRDHLDAGPWSHFRRAHRRLAQCPELPALRALASIPT